MTNPEKIQLPDADRPEGYRQDYGTRPRQGPTSAEKVSGKIVIPKTQGEYLGFRVVSKVEDGLFWQLTYEGPDGVQHTTRKLRASREGHG